VKRMKSLGAAEVVTEDFAASHRMKDLLTVCHSEGTFSIQDSQIGIQLCWRKKFHDPSQTSQ
jgi:hypothetical protein